MPLPPHPLQFHRPCSTYLLNELLQAWQKPHCLWTVRRSSKFITMTQNNSIQMSKFRSSGDMSLVKGYLQTNKMFDTIYAKDFVDRLSCLSAAAATPPCCRRCRRRRLCLEPWTPLKYSVSHNFIYPYLFARNQGNHQTFFPSLVPINLWWICIKMKQKK